METSKKIEAINNCIRYYEAHIRRKMTMDEFNDLIAAVEEIPHIGSVDLSVVNNMTNNYEFYIWTEEDDIREQKEAELQEQYRKEKIITDIERIKYLSERNDKHDPTMYLLLLGLIFWVCYIALGVVK